MHDNQDNDVAVQRRFARPKVFSTTQTGDEDKPIVATSTGQSAPEQADIRDPFAAIAPSSSSALPPKNAMSILAKWTNHLARPMVSQNHHRCQRPCPV